MAEEIKKSYAGITDNQMLAEAQTILDLFTAHQAEFAAFDASLDNTFKTTLQGKIDNAFDFPSDETVQDEISELTDAVMAAWDDCKTCFQDAKYFIEKAFPGNKARHNVFGFDDYTDMSRSQNNVLSFMKQFGATAAKYNTELIAAGYTQLKIDAILELAEAFDNANRAQDQAKKVRPEVTQARTQVMNNVWAGIKTINLASKSVYRNNYALLQSFLMPAAASNEARENLSLTGTIINTVTNLPEPGVAVSLPELGLATIADLNGSYAFAAGTPAGETPLHGVKPGLNEYDSTVVLVDETTVVKNFQMSPV